MSVCLLLINKTKRTFKTTNLIKMSRFVTLSEEELNCLDSNKDEKAPRGRSKDLWIYSGSFSVKTRILRFFRKCHLAFFGIAKSQLSWLPLLSCLCWYSSSDHVTLFQRIAIGALLDYLVGNRSKQIIQSKFKLISTINRKKRVFMHGEAIL